MNHLGLSYASWVLMMWDLCRELGGLGFRVWGFRVAGFEFWERVWGVGSIEESGKFPRHGEVAGLPRTAYSLNPKP